MPAYLEEEKGKNISAVRSSLFSLCKSFIDKFGGTFFPLPPPPNPFQQCSAELDQEETKAFAALEEEFTREMCNAIEADCQRQAR